MCSGFFGDRDSVWLLTASSGDSVYTGLVHLLPAFGVTAEHSRVLHEVALLFALDSANLIASESGVIWILKTINVFIDV